VVTVRGAGPAFSSGLDRAMFTPPGVPGAPSLADLAALPVGEAERWIEGAQQAFSWLGRPGLVSIAVVRGHAIGAGFQLALACDLRVVAEDVSFAMAETSLGLVPDLGGTGVLVNLLGYARALEICLTGRRVGAAEAVQTGLATLAVPGEELDAAADELAAAVLAAPDAAVRETKSLLAGARERSPAEQLRAEREAQVRRLRALAGEAD
jgi:enoyl-CoA hydratase/carnithine racemase